MRALTEYIEYISTFGKIEFCISKKSLQCLEYILAALLIICVLPIPFSPVVTFFRAAVFNDGYDMLVTTCALLCFACVTLYDLTPSSLSFSRA